MTDRSMENIFSILSSGLPSPAKAAVAESGPKAARTPSGMPTEDLVEAWKRNETEALTSELLSRMQPTIASAFSTFAPGQDDKLAVKAAGIALQALRSYNPKFGVSPATHVFNGLKRLSRLSASRSAVIPVSESAALERRRVQDIAARFEDDKGREPSDQELADLTGLSRRRLEALLSQNTVVSESSTLSEDSQRDTLGRKDLTDDDYFEYVYTSVDPVNQKIMEWSSGRHGKPVLSVNEIAQKLRMSAPAVSQRKARIMGMLSDVRSLV